MANVNRFIYTVAVLVSILLGIVNGFMGDYAQGAYSLSFAAVLLLLAGRDRLGPRG